MFIFSPLGYLGYREQANLVYFFLFFLSFNGILQNGVIFFLSLVTLNYFALKLEFCLQMDPITKEHERPFNLEFSVFDTLPFKCIFLV